MRSSRRIRGHQSWPLNKTHWISLALNGDLPPALIKECITHSYELVFKGLTKKMQNEVISEI